jgi:hypothetical protein
VEVWGSDLLPQQICGCQRRLLSSQISLYHVKVKTSMASSALRWKLVVKCKSCNKKVMLSSKSCCQVSHAVLPGQESDNEIVVESICNETRS